jgi:hypothetical protein
LILVDTNSWIFHLRAWGLRSPVRVDDARDKLSSVKLEIETDASRGAQRVVNYVGALGPAALASLEGGLLLWSRNGDRALLEDVGAAVSLACVEASHDPSTRRVACLRLASTCIFYARVTASEVLFVIVDYEIGPAAVLSRLQGALAVFDRVRVTRARGGSPGAPAPAEVSAVTERSRSIS